MRKKSLVGLLVTAMCCLYSRPLHGQVAEFIPPQPAVGKEFLVTYDAGAPAAVLKNATAVTAEVLIMRDRQAPLAREVALERLGSVWKGTCKVDDPRSLLFLVRFTSGDMIDDNNESSWVVLVHGSDGKPVQGAILQQAMLSVSGRQLEFKYPRDAVKAKDLTQRELTLYPGNWRAEVFRLRSTLREKPDQEGLDAVRRDIERVYEANKENEEAVAALLPLFEQAGLKERSDRIKSNAFAANPRGTIAQSVRSAEMMTTRDPAKRVQLVEAFLKDFPDAPDAEQYRTVLVSSYAGLGQRDKAIELLSKLPRPPASLYNSIARPMIEKADDLEKGTLLAKQGVELLRVPDPASKPSYLSSKQWQGQNVSGLAALLDTYGLGLLKTNKMTEAESVLEEAYTLSKGDEAEISERYVECLVENKKYERALAVCDESVRRGKANERLREHYKEAFVKAKGSDAGFDVLLSTAESAAQAEFKKKLLKERLDKPAIDFSLRGFDGKTVRLADLKGRVVVIDFWATWCGPCKNSFPYLQKVYETYKGDPRVAIYALNAWERVSGAERDAAVRKFIADNKYTFPVLFDEDTIEKYGVTGIPTKFVIDKEGKLQFKSIGFEGGDAMMNELTNQLELLLADEFYQK